MTENTPPLIDGALEVGLNAIIDERPLENGDPYALIVIDAEKSKGPRLSILLRAGGFDGPLSTYGFLRTVMATLASGEEIRDEITRHVREALREALVDAGVANGAADDPPWLTELLDALVGVAVAR